MPAAQTHSPGRILWLRKFLSWEPLEIEECLLDAYLALTNTFPGICHRLSLEMGQWVSLIFGLIHMSLLYP